MLCIRQQLISVKVARNFITHRKRLMGLTRHHVLPRLLRGIYGSLHGLHAGLVYHSPSVMVCRPVFA